jgi:tight adherence protein B
MPVMLIAVGTFGLVVVLILGIYWLGVVRPEDQEHTLLRKRLKSSIAKARKRLELVKEEQHFSDVPQLDRLLVRASRTILPLQRLIDQSGVNITVGLFLLASAFAGVLAYVVGQHVTHHALVGVIAGVAASAIPYAYIRWARSNRLRKFEEAFPEAIDLIVRALRAGHAFTTGIGMVASELAPPVGTEFKILHDRQNFGQPVAEALKAFADRVPLIDSRFFVTAVLTQRESGGNLAEVLENLASVIRDRFKLKRQIRAVTAHGRITGLVLACLPPFLAVIFYVQGPENFTPLFTDPLGIRMVILAVALQIIGVLVMRKLINFEY